MKPIKRIVVKLGTQVVMDVEAAGPASERLRAIVADIAQLRTEGTEVVLVSSGAVGLGRKALGLTPPLKLPEKQACAAVGQGFLMTLYSELFLPFGMKVAQVLVTGHDFSDRSRYLNLKNTFDQLLRLGAIPIVNENDVISVAGLVESGFAHSFDDNDKLSALVAGKLGAEMLVILTNVNGVFDRNPEDKDAKLITTIDTFDELAKISSDGQSALGRGGMTSKLSAAKIASLCGVKTIVANGNSSTPIANAISRRSGTLIAPQEALSVRERWIGLSSGYNGVVHIDANAVRALVRDGKSLLPVGIRAVSGDFSRGDVISIQDEDGNEIGRGLANQSSLSAKKVKGLHSTAAKPLLLPGEKVEVVHCDNLVLFEDTNAGREA